MELHSGPVEQGVSSAWRHTSQTELVLEEVNSARLAASTLAWQEKASVNGSKAKPEPVSQFLWRNWEL